MGFSTHQRRQKTAAAIASRLEACRQYPENQTCADCGEDSPAWASLLVAPERGTKRFGIFCCYKCCSYHFQLGRDVCQVKNIKQADSWTEEEVKTMEASGNDISNAIYEGLLVSKRQKPDPEDHEAQAAFVEAKYKTLTYFCKKTYQAQISWFSTTAAQDAINANNNNKSTHSMRSFAVEEVITTEEETSDDKSDSFASGFLSSRSFVDLGYGDVEDTPLFEAPVDRGFYQEADLGYNVDLGYDDAEQSRNDVDEDLAQQLAKRAIDGGGKIRRGSMGLRRDSVGGRSTGSRHGSIRGRRSSAVGTTTSESNLESPTSTHSRRTGRRSSMGTAFQRRGSVGGAPKLSLECTNSTHCIRGGRRMSMSGATSSRRGSMGGGGEGETENPSSTHSGRVRRTISSSRRRSSMGYNTNDSQGSTAAHSPVRISRPSRIRRASTCDGRLGDDEGGSSHHSRRRSIGIQRRNSTASACSLDSFEG